MTDPVQVFTNSGTSEPGHMIMTVTKDKHWYHFELTHPASPQVNGRLSVSMDGRSAAMSLYGDDMEQWLTFNTGVNLCYLYSSSQLDTVLVHASCVKWQDRAYLFLGKSGTGKSTHSRMWLRALKDVELMNDDHPVIRLNDEGEVIAYGYPWSGKTICYKNIQAKVGGIIRIARAPYNKARRLSSVEAYGSLMTSCSGMVWEKELADGRDRTMQGIIGSVPCWVMQCLPDEDAALVCSKTVAEV